MLETELVTERVDDSARERLLALSEWWSLVRGRPGSGVRVSREVRMEEMTCGLAALVLLRLGADFGVCRYGESGAGWR